MATSTYATHTFVNSFRIYFSLFTEHALAEQNQHGGCCNICGKVYINMQKIHIG